MRFLLSRYTTVRVFRGSFPFTKAAIRVGEGVEPSLSAHTNLHAEGPHHAIRHRKFPTLAIVHIGGREDQTRDPDVQKAASRGTRAFLSTNRSENAFRPLAPLLPLRRLVVHAEPGEAEQVGRGVQGHRREADRKIARNATAVAVLASRPRPPFLFLPPTILAASSVGAAVNGATVAFPPSSPSSSSSSWERGR